MTRILELAPKRAVLLGEYALPIGMECDLQLIVPSLDINKAATVADLQVIVNEVVFISKGIRLVCRVKSLSDEAMQLIESRKT